jgi:tRNA 2-selenouridine synthase
VLDLERLARHRGSLLGELPGAPQPSQKMFDGLVWKALKQLDPARPVLVEAESKKIGQLQVPGKLLERMRDGECLRLEVPVAERVRFLIEEYGHFLSDPDALKERLACLTDRYGRAVIGGWLTKIDSGEWPGLVADLLLTHYDPSYVRATRQNYMQYDGARRLTLDRLDEAEMERVARELSEAVV